jgi:hypothetical protein
LFCVSSRVVGRLPFISENREAPQVGTET